jgi:P2-related tail formation protein
VGEKIPAPKNKAIEAAKVVLEKLIEGVGVDLAVSAATAAWPFLASPIVRVIFRWAVELIAKAIDENLFKFAVKIIIRVQSTSRKEEFNSAILPIVNGSPTDEEIERAREAAYRLIERNR